LWTIGFISRFTVGGMTAYAGRAGADFVLHNSLCLMLTFITRYRGVVFGISPASPTGSEGVGFS